MSLKPLLQKSFPLTRDLIRNQWFLLGLLFLIGSVVTISAEDAVTQLTRGQEDSRWIYQLSLGLWDLFEGIASILILCAGVTNSRQLSSRHFLNQPFSTPFLGSFIAEYLRVLAQVLLWGLLFIIPGFVRYCRLLFVPMITLLSRDYRDGKVDALDLSTRLSQGCMNWLIPTVFLTAVIQGGLEILPNMIPDLHTVPFRLGFSLLSFLIAVWTFSFFYLIFEEGLTHLES